MVRAAYIVATLILSGFALGSVGCKEEPTIVIKFEPNDLGTTKPADLLPRDAARPADLATVAAKGDEGKGGKPAAAGGECKVAADCVVEPVDCCNCNSGGSQHAIAKSKAAAAAAKRASKCGHTMCPMFVSHDKSCSMEPACVEGACVLTAAGAATKKPAAKKPAAE